VRLPFAYTPIRNEISMNAGVAAFSPGNLANAVSATLMLDPLVARQLKEVDSFVAKEDFSRWISENALMPAGRFWGADHIDMLVSPRADAGEEPFATWRKAADDEPIAHYHDPERINIVVIGGETSPVWKTTDYGCWGSAPVDYWRPGKAPGRAAADCADGVCGLPDPDVEYDD